MRGEVFLRRFLSVVSVLLFITQAVLFRDDTRIYFSQVDYLEGQPISVEEKAANHNLVMVENVVSSKQVLRKNKEITIRMIKPVRSKDVFVTVNGQKAGDFTNGYITFSVYSGDYIEIDATNLTEDGQYVVNTADADQLKNINGLFLESKQNIITLGKIKFTQ